METAKTAKSIAAFFAAIFTIFTLWATTGPSDMDSLGLLNIEERFWRDIAFKRREDIYYKIPEQWLLSKDVLEAATTRRKITGDFIERLLDDETREITNLDPVDIRKHLQAGCFTAVQVVGAFCKRAAYSHQLNNNLLDITFKSAFDRAAELDLYFKEHNKTVGPLHGLPVSFKDQFHVKGSPATMAYVGWIGTFEGKKGTGREETTESELVKELYSLGAVPIAKTSLVQSLWAGETNNNILGYLWNPNHKQLSSGGSSGGEAALQSLRGSAFGFGTDIGGSVGMPAAFNGIYSIKPSHGRLSFKDVATSSPGQVTIPSVVGILGPSIATLRLVFESLMSTKPWLHDPEVLNIPWRADEENLIKATPSLSFGFFECDGVVNPHPPIIRALRIVANSLAAEGHEIIAWKPPTHRESCILHESFTRADGSGDVLEAVALSGEPLVPQIKNLFSSGPNDPISLLEYYNNTLKLQDFRSRYRAYWLSTEDETKTGHPVDAVILPISPHAAVIPGQYHYYTYSNFVNVLDYVSIVIPVTTANQKIDVFDHNYVPLSDADKLNWMAYDPEKYDGAPAAIQILGRRLEEEKLLSIAQVVVDAIAKHPENYRAQFR